MKKSSFYILILILVVLTSCSWMGQRKALFEAKKEQDKTPEKVMTVPKEQYDALLLKYEQLQAQLQSSDATRDGLLQDLSNVPLQSTETPLSDTVDVFADEKSSENNKVIIAPDVSQAPAASSEISRELEEFNKAIRFLEQNKVNQALSLFKQLEKSSIKQISAKSKFYIGELLFIQKEYDLAMQVFENIIQNHAFSGMVIQTLGRLIVCSEKLNQSKKKEQYFSILHDFFGSGA